MINKVLVQHPRSIGALFVVALVVAVGLVVGCQGIVGPEGPEGPRGPEGPEGPEGPTGANEKQVRFHIVDRFQRINYANPFPVDSLIKFNIDYYPDVDSAIFIANAKNDKGEAPVYVDLYNTTDQDTVATLSVTDTNYTALESENVAEVLPSKEVTLAVYLRANGEIISITDAWLFLYRS